MNKALPLWSRRARDDVHGGYFEALTPEGEPRSGDPKRLRVQARQAFAFARCEALGFIPDGREASDEGFGFMHRFGFREAKDGLPRGFVHVLNPDGSVKDPQRDTYDHAFVLLAASERLKVYGGDRERDVAREVFDFLDEIRHAEGGFANGAPASPPRCQNPHMHLFEALLNFKSIPGFPRAPQERKNLASLFREKFWNAEENALLEFFRDDWSPDPERGCEVMPGHMPEWVFLLHQLGGVPTDFLLTLQERGRELGMAGDRPFLSTSANLRTGKRHGDYRLWAQCEHVRGCLVIADLLQDEAWRDEAGNILGAVRQSFFSGRVVPGGWHDAVDEDGQVVSDRMPTSTLYHVVTLAEEVANAL
jgi:mannose-6-phosphate isomerase